MKTSGQGAPSMDETSSAYGSSLTGEGDLSSSVQPAGGQNSSRMRGVANTPPLEDISLSSEFGGEQSNQNLYAANLPNEGMSSSNPFSLGSIESDTGSSHYELSGNSSSATENAFRLRESGANSRLVRRPNPYNNIPSLYDMYLQATPRPAALERFGMQVFRYGSRDLQAIPTDLPVGPEYVLGPGDAVSIDLWGGVSKKFIEVVDREGRISLPETGPVMVSGRSLADVQQSVQRTLRTQFRDVSADVSLAKLRTIRVYVVGDVAQPGAYDIGSLSTPLNALFSAGGPTSRGSLRILKHLRGNQLVQDVDVYDLLLHGVKGNLQRLENGDTVMVPPLGPEVNIEGMVRRPAIYEEKDEQSLADALSLAGGLLPGATLRHIEVQRLVAHQKRTMLSFDIPQDDSAGDSLRQLESFHIQDGDKIRIFPIAPYAQDAVYLEGHVIRPGKYSFRAGMRVTDLISSYKTSIGLWRDHSPEPTGFSSHSAKLRSHAGAGGPKQGPAIAAAGHGSDFRPLRFRGSASRLGVR
ncbi:MAG: hypothetical protein DMG79_11055 [Acidobacteria bacterium]|nr:MAG: hypothetical protein DMG79_11055 [Acidobacteriota bacterium]